MRETGYYWVQKALVIGPGEFDIAWWDAKMNGWFFAGTTDMFEEDDLYFIHSQRILSPGELASSVGHATPPA